MCLGTANTGWGRIPNAESAQTLEALKEVREASRGPALGHLGQLLKGAAKRSILLLMAFKRSTGSTGSSGRGKATTGGRSKAGAAKVHASPATDTPTSRPRLPVPALKPPSKQSTKTAPKKALTGKVLHRPAEKKIPLTLRLTEGEFMRLELMATAENRSLANFAETHLLESMAAKEEAARVITMYVPDELKDVQLGPLLRSEGESDERYAERSALLSELFALGSSAD